MKIKTFLFLLILVSISSLLGVVPPSEVCGQNTFAEKYRVYQTSIREAKTALDKKDYQKAVELYSKALEMSPFEALNYYNRGIALYRLGREREAIDDFDRVLILDPRISTAYIYRGLCRMKSGEYQGALSDYQKALEFNPKDASLHNNLAWLYATAKDEKVRDKIKALEHAVKAAEMSNEKNAEILDTLARVYFINGKIRDAVETEKKALKLEPNNEKFKENLREYEKATPSLP
jgi:tetratricopeptide (TPR) repeat protein